MVPRSHPALHGTHYWLIRRATRLVLVLQINNIRGAQSRAFVRQWRTRRMDRARNEPEKGGVTGLSQQRAQMDQSCREQQN